MQVKYYEINGCNAVKVHGDNPHDTRYIVYAPDNTPPEILKRYGFSVGYDGGTKYNYKYLNNDETAEMYNNMSPDKSWSVIGNGRYIAKADKETAKKLCWVSAAALVMPIISYVLSVFMLASLNMNVDSGMSNEAPQILISIIGTISNIAPIVGIVTLVIARSKDPSSKFVKALIITYVVIAIIAIIIFVLTAIMCGIGFGACMGELRNCS